jgi:hypothetical protein
MIVAMKTPHAALRALRAHPKEGRPATADRRAHTSDLDPGPAPITGAFHPSEIQSFFVTRCAPLDKEAPNP